MLKSIKMPKKMEPYIDLAVPLPAVIRYSTTLLPTVCHGI
jgi:hypothetical protein